jgi:hypothetical protein
VFPETCTVPILPPNAKVLAVEYMPVAGLVLLSSQRYVSLSPLPENEVARKRNLACVDPAATILAFHPPGLS